MPASFILLVLALAAGCASEPAEENPNASAAQLYQQGKEALDDQYYETAVKRFETLSARYPFGIYAQQAQLDIAYAYYQLNQPDSAIAAADLFIKTYPRSPKVDYAYYLRGLANFGTRRGLLDKWIENEPAMRDPEWARQSFQYFAELVKRFPDSVYAADAVQRMIYLKNFLARHEMYVARYYMKRGAYVAAADRAKTIIEDYPRTESVPDALKVLADAYGKLGLEDLAADARRVLEENSAKD